MKKFLKFILFLVVVGVAYSIFSDSEPAGEENNTYDFVIQTASDAVDGMENMGLPDVPAPGESLAEGPDESLLWGYAQLTAEEQEVYVKIRDAAGAYSKAQIPVNISYDSLERALDAINYDHPEIFWFDGSLTYYSDESGDMVLFVELDYNMEESDIPMAQVYIDNFVAGCMADEAVVSANNDVERVIAVYRYLVEHTEYDLAYQEQQSVLSLMQEGKAVCRGYAESFCLIMHRMGIPCTIVEGLSSQEWVLSTEGHAWNAVMLYDQWYNIDVTWGDPVYSEGADPTTPADGYILVSDEFFDRDHTDFSALGSPQCTVMDYNYHAIYSLLFTEWNEEYFRWAVQAQLDLGLPWAQVRYANYEAYYQAKSALIDGEGLGDIVMDLGFGKKEGNYTSWSYNCDDTTGVIAVKLIY